VLFEFADKSDCDDPAIDAVSPPLPAKEKQGKGPALKSSSDSRTARHLS
jgi:hypothetical protein